MEARKHGPMDTDYDVDVPWRPECLSPKYTKLELGVSALGATTSNVEAVGRCSEVEL